MTEPREPLSALTRAHPALWIKATTLATRVTGILYEPKVTGQDGSIYSCGGGFWRPHRNGLQSKSSGNLSNL